MAGASTERVNRAVQNALLDAYGIDGELSSLPGENPNFLVHAASGHRYVAKLAGDQQPPEYVVLEQAVLEHLGREALRLDLPQLYENKYGNYETVIYISENHSKRLRLMHFIEGDCWTEISDISNELRFDLGRKLACLDHAMRGFDHPLAHRTHRWDLTRLHQHSEKIQWIEDPDRRALLAWAMAYYTNEYSSIESHFSKTFPS